ncbi:CAMK2G [Symbiodinium natans]|uniref:non-specific serine/threonine protein kinase n=1 Tax=Symbiodinium natans TaxID=878477 RepID=A0A812LB27_9DINO|nr:CAMK2G [Symbiodinium natans]
MLASERERQRKRLPSPRLPESREAAALHQGLRECLSTFQDLSSAHVVRYETYWLEEPEHLPQDIRQLVGEPAPKPVKTEVQVTEDEASRVSSLRFRVRQSSSYGGLRRTRSHSDVYPTPSGLNSSCGFIFEAPEFAEEIEPTRPRSPWQENRNDSKATAKKVVLLIEMELMGPPPGGTVSDERQTLTLRSWLKRENRTLSDAADIFGSLMLSVRHIHRKRIVHADLKPDNIFCVAERSKVRVVRIGDFGLAGENQLFRQFDQFSSDMLTTRSGLTGGTPGYAAPEILQSVRQGQRAACSDKVDIYSCAMASKSVYFSRDRLDTSSQRGTSCLSSCPLFLVSP